VGHGSDRHGLSDLAQRPAQILRNAINAFSKYAVPILSKTGEAVATAFRTILANTGTSSSRRRLAVRTGKGPSSLGDDIRTLAAASEADNAAPAGR